MAPGKRKKKAAANPSRGFATVSVPSKGSLDARTRSDSKDQESSSAVEPGTSSPGTPGDQYAGLASASQAPGEVSGVPQEQLERDLEDAELQMLLDNHAPRCKLDANRQAERLRLERRTLRLRAVASETDLWLSRELRDLVLQKERLYVSTDSLELDKSNLSAASNDLLLKLWVLYQTLTQLQLPYVEESLTYVITLSFHHRLKPSKDDVWGLNEALNWIAMNVEGTLLPYNEQNQNESLPEISELLEEDDPRGVDKEGLEITESNVANAEQPSESYSPVQNSEEGEPLTFTDDEDNDPSQLIDKYLQARTALLTLGNRADGPRQPRMRKVTLESRIAKIEGDPLFEREEAQVKWRNLEAGLRADLARQGRATRSQEQGTALQPKHQEVLTVKPRDSEDETDEDDLFSTMFADDDDTKRAISDTLSAEVSQTKLVDFGHWIGAHPRKLLEEACKSIDAKSSVMSKPVVSLTHLSKWKVSIRWSKPQRGDPWLQPSMLFEFKCRISARNLYFEMESVAAATAKQAEAYISTVALFYVSNAASSDRQLFSRLPPVWRDVISDLKARRQAAISEHDKMCLRKLRGLVEELIHRQSDRAQKRPFPVSAKDPDTTGGLNRGLTSATQKLDGVSARGEWQRRCNSVGFKTMLQTRQTLPIHQHRDEILQMMENSAVSILSSETGSGKSTQMPSFILGERLQAGQDCRILITQPRRISAMSLARRVSQELGEAPADLGTTRSLVGYAIRMESKTSASTRITFATTGVLLRMLESSPDLEQIDVVILDEVHERTMDLDLLFIVFRKVITRNSNLKLLLMSATIDAARISEYFTGAPFLNIPGRTFPVEVGFLEDVVQAVSKQIRPREVGGHPKLDDEDGFTTGEAVPSPEESEDDVAMQQQHNPASLSTYSRDTRMFLSSFDEYRIDYDLIVQLILFISRSSKYKKYSAAFLIFMPGLSEIRRLQRAVLSEPYFSDGWIIHLLHSSFTMEDLERAFSIPPSGIRKIVIATNIAETGVTIPDITAVIDTCKEKVMRYDDKRQVSKLREGFISRSSALQRKGRAARVQDGLCFHLVTKHRYENFMSEQHVPEMLRLSLQNPVLRVKIWKLGNIEDILLQAIDPPTKRNVRRAISVLQDAGALTTCEELTPLGKQIARLPLDVELGKLCILGVAFKCLDSAVTIAAILSSKSPFLDTDNRGSAAKGQPTPDSTDSKLLQTYKLYVTWKRMRRAGMAAEYCRKQSLSNQGLVHIEEQKLQLLTSLLEVGLISLDSDEATGLRKARNSRSNTVAFETPGRYDQFSHMDDWVCSVVAMAFYPKLMVRERKLWRNIVTNQQISHSQVSQNSGTSLNSRWMTFFQAMQDKNGRYKVFHTSMVPECALIPLIGQAAEFRVYSGVVKLDGGRANLAVQDWEATIVLKVLREKFWSLLNKFLQTPHHAWSEDDQFWFEAMYKVINGRAEKEDSFVKGLAER